MNLGARGDNGFDSLLGHTVTFLVDGRRTNLTLARYLVESLTTRKRLCTVLDVDAFYASNSEYIFGSLSKDDSLGPELLIPGPGSDLKNEFGQVLGADPQRTLIIDSLNSVFHLLPAEGHGSRTRSLEFVISLLSHLSRIDGRTIFLTMYQRNYRLEGKNSISGLSDNTIRVSLTDGVLSFKTKPDSW
jgi:hypothetical protein